MAMTNCKECGGKISEDALSCAVCGHPLHPRSDDWFALNTERVGLAIVLLATGLQVFLVDKLRVAQSTAEFMQIDHKLNHMFGALTSVNPSNYPAMSKANFEVFDYIGSDLWLNDLFGTILGAMFVIGSGMIVASKFMER